MKFKIKMMSLAAENLRDIRRYISVELDNPYSAQKICGEIAKRINDLADNPFLYPLYEDEPWKSRGIRHLVVRKYIVYYFADERSKTVSVLKIAGGAQSPENRLQGI